MDPAKIGQEVHARRVEDVLDAPGIDVMAPEPQALSNALAIAARSASTSYKEVLTAHQLSDILRSGTAPEKFHPHLMALLDELPLPVVLQAVSEAATPETPSHQIMKHLRHWAAQWQTYRPVWR